MTSSMLVAKRETGQSHRGRQEVLLITLKGERHRGGRIFMLSCLGALRHPEEEERYGSDHPPENESREQSRFQKFKYLDVNNFQRKDSSKRLEGAVLVEEGISHIKGRLGSSGR